MPIAEFSVKALGTSITIAADESRDYLAALLETYQKELEKTKSATKLEDPLKIAVLTGFVLGDEIQKLKTEIERLKREDLRGTEEQPEMAESLEAETLTLKLISRLEDAFDIIDTGHSDGAEKTETPDKTTGLAGIAGPGKSKNSAKAGPGVIKLANPVKNYSWGSPDWIPSLLGEKNESNIPWAELWMGVHPEGPSRLAGSGRAARDTALPGPLLSSLIAQAPSYYLGEETEKAFGGLPFLFKALAADKPLSIQAHPNLEQAREGFEKENRAGIDPKSPERNYKDPNHKPEIICALNHFTAMCGFREKDEIETLLNCFSEGASPALKAGLEKLLSALEGAGPEPPLKTFLQSVFNMEETTRGEISIRALSGSAAKNFPQYEKEFRLVSAFAESYPKDPAVIAPLYLNVLELNPGEAVYLPAGILHAYVRGFGVELMANSDNVLRGGLTPKHIDKPELFRVLDFEPWKPEVLKPAFSAAYRYPAPCREFSLTALSGGELFYTGKGPAIIFVTSGELAVGPRKDTILRRGETAFIPAAEAAAGLRFQGGYTAYLAGIGAAEIAGKDSPSL